MNDCHDLMRLLEQAQSGNEGAKDALFAKCREFLSMVAQAELAAGLQQKVDASDLVQESLIEADRGLTGFRGATVEEWQAWLRKIVRHNALDFNRRYQGAAKRQASREQSFAQNANPDESRCDWEPAGDDDTPSQQLMKTEESMELLAVMAALPDDYQRVLKLRNLENLPFDVVAEKMGRTRPAVQMLWTRAVRKLRSLMDGEPVETTDVDALNTSD